MNENELLGELDEATDALGDPDGLETEVTFETLDGSQFSISGVRTEGGHIVLECGETVF